jgi:hypothetical protein
VEVYIVASRIPARKLCGDTLKVHKSEDSMLLAYYSASYAKVLPEDSTDRFAKLFRVYQSEKGLP